MDRSGAIPLALQLLNSAEVDFTLEVPTSADTSQPGGNIALADQHPEVIFCDKTYKATSAEVDIILPQEESQDSKSQGSVDTTRAVRLIVTFYPSQSSQTPTQDSPSANLQAAAHLILRPHATQKPQVDLILDLEALTKHIENSLKHNTPQRASRISTSQPAPSSSSLATIYRDYIAAINARHMAESLPRFCHPIVIHNDRALALDKYRQLMEDAQEAIPDIKFVISDLLVDEARGMVCARLEFRGTPMGEFAGVRPPVTRGTRVPGGQGDAEARKVKFSEIVFYWFEREKIREVVSVVDVDAYRTQLEA